MKHLILSIILLSLSGYAAASSVKSSKCDGNGAGYYVCAAAAVVDGEGCGYSYGPSVLTCEDTGAIGGDAWPTFKCDIDDGMWIADSSSAGYRCEPTPDN